MRMALDLGLHRALEKLAEETGKQRPQEEERNLGLYLLSFPGRGNATPGVCIILIYFLSRISQNLALSILV